MNTLYTNIMSIFLLNTGNCVIIKINKEQTALLIRAVTSCNKETPTSFFIAKAPIIISKT